MGTQVWKRREKETNTNQTMKDASGSPPKLLSRRWLPQDASLLVPHSSLVSSSDQTPPLVSSLVPSFPVSKLLSPNLTPVVLGITPRKKLRPTDLATEDWAEDARVLRLANRHCRALVLHGDEESHQES